MVYNKYQLGIELILNNKTVIYKGYEIKRNFTKKAFQVKKDKKTKYFIETQDILDYIKKDSSR